MDLSRYPRAPAESARCISTSPSKVVRTRTRASGNSRADRDQCLDTAHVWKPEVHQCDVRLELRVEADGFPRRSTQYPRFAMSDWQLIIAEIPLALEGDRRR
jgi:hypothetical protein